MNQEEISAAVGKILQNPDFAGLVRDLRGDQKESGDLMAQLPEVLARLEPILGSVEALQPMQPIHQSAESNHSSDSTAGEQPQPGPEAVLKESANPLRRYDKARAEKLMSALKPYLKPERCEIIDRCMSAMQLTDVIGVLRELEGQGRGKA